MRLNHDHTTMTERLKENKEKIKMNQQLPHLVGNVVEVFHTSFNLDQILKIAPEDQEDGASLDLDAQRNGKCAVIKTSTRQVGVHC